MVSPSCCFLGCCGCQSLISISIDNAESSNFKGKGEIEETKTERSKKRIYITCDLCRKTNSHELHCLSSLSIEAFDLLCQVNLQTLSHSNRACYDHFELHIGKPSKKRPLTVRTAFASPSCLSQPKCPLPCYQNFGPSYKSKKSLEERLRQLEVENEEL